jgi:NAD(P)-dependent dehydrogenase (short-subunit alcohol dehydrogenase family)
MSSLISSLTDGARVVIVGANGGIGSALVDTLASDERVAQVFALSRRSATGAGALVEPVIVDITDEQSVRSAATICGEPGPVDLVVIATGMLHRPADIQPEKRLKDIDSSAMEEVLCINTVAPAILAKYLLPVMRRDHKAVFAAISARVGSIGDNRLGGWASYRASKAALNMLIRTFSIEHSRTHPESLVLALHPGTTDTALSRPFQKNVPAGKLFSPQFTATRLLQVIDNLRPEASGGFFAWDGEPIDY